MQSCENGTWLFIRTKSRYGRSGRNGTSTVWSPARCWKSLGSGWWPRGSATSIGWAEWPHSLGPMRNGIFPNTAQRTSFFSKRQCDNPSTAALNCSKIAAEVCPHRHPFFLFFDQGYNSDLGFRLENVLTRRIRRFSLSFGAPGATLLAKEHYLRSVASFRTR